MNCKTCQKNLEIYLQGGMPEDMKEKLKIHLNECDECKVYYSTIILTEKIVQEETLIESNPFLSTRIMAKIESMEENRVILEQYSIFNKVFKPMFLTALVAIAVFIGIFTGNLYKPAQIYSEVPEELIFLSDASIESLSVLINE